MLLMLLMLLGPRPCSAGCRRRRRTGGRGCGREGLERRPSCGCGARRSLHGRSCGKRIRRPRLWACAAFGAWGLRLRLRLLLVGDVRKIHRRRPGDGCSCDGRGRSRGGRRRSRGMSRLGRKRGALSLRKEGLRRRRQTPANCCKVSTHRRKTTPHAGALRGKASKGGQSARPTSSASCVRRREKPPGLDGGRLRPLGRKPGLGQKASSLRGGRQQLRSRRRLLRSVNLRNRRRQTQSSAGRSSSASGGSPSASSSTRPQRRRHCGEGRRSLRRET